MVCLFASYVESIILVDLNLAFKYKCNTYTLYPRFTPTFPHPFVLHSTDAVPDEIPSTVLIYVVTALLSCCTYLNNKVLILYFQFLCKGTNVVGINSHGPYQNVMLKEKL